MATVIETDQTENLTPSPAREDGGLWPFALLVSDETVYADTLTELVSHMIPGYADFASGSEGDGLAFLARVDSASQLVAQAQAVILATATNEDGFRLEDESETTLTALLSPRGTGLVTGADFGSRWDHTVPLLLVSTDYAPYSEHKLIEGNVTYFDPSTERTYLESLQALGFVELFVNAQL